MSIKGAIDKLQDLRSHMKAQVRVYQDALKHDCETEDEKSDMNGHINIVSMWIKKIESALSELDGR